MRKIGIITLALLLLASFTPAAEEGTRPKVGLVLSGGGARGIAHLGTLALIDSLNIPIDYIAGTSMGGIVGALYSIGYDAIEIEQIVRNLNWEAYFSDQPDRHLTPYQQRKDDGRFQMELKLDGWRPVPPTGLISGQKIRLLLSQFTYAYENVSHFDELPIPFRCVTVDLITGNEVVLESGSLSKAIRATMSIPTLFDPVEWGDSLLIDGGLLNNVPVNVVREMGADVVITCNVGRPSRTRDELNTMLEILEQSITIPEYNREAETLPLSDIVITPNLARLNPADFSAANIDAILREGFVAADSLRGELEDLVRLHGLAKPRSTFQAKQTPSRLFGIHFSGNTTLPFRYLYDLSGLTPGDTVDAARVEDRLRAMRTSEHIHSLRLDAEMISENEVVLRIHVKESSYPEIDGILIKGNESLPFSYIHEFLDIHHGDPFNPAVIEDHINQLYSLGVFETVHYEIDPIDENRLRLIIHVKEKPENRLRLGGRYDNYYNLIGHLGIVHENFLVPGLHLESSLQFAGRDEWDTRLLFPINFQGWMAFPYIHTQVMRETRPLYDFVDHIALYRDRRRFASAGVGVYPSRTMVLEAEVMWQTVDISSEFVYGGVTGWNDTFTRFNLFATVDNLDNVLVPELGERFEFRFATGLPLLEYQRFSFRGSWYRPQSAGRNICFSTRLGYSAGADTLLYDWFHAEGGRDFVGMDYFEMAWKRYFTLRMDYRIKLEPGLYVNLSYNAAPNMTLGRERLYPSDRVWIDGAGIGLLYDSFVGPIELTVGIGDAIWADAGFQTLTYFTAGYHF